MANLIKNQLFKHLAKYFKNLSTDSFKLSAMKGYCELHHLELNEEVLMDLLELPVWLNITKATCSHAAIKIPWAKLNVIPICLGLDEVNVEVEICEDFRTLKSFSQSSQNVSKYGFISRAIDGIRITIGSVIVKFTSPSLKASFELTQLEVQSRPPNWKPTRDLRDTNFKDKERGLVLNFKHIEWQTMKFEAKTESTAFSAPLRLICQGSCRVMIKKRIADCQVMGARIVLMFDDLLWVLTDAMLVSAFHFVTYINELIKRAPLTKKVIEETSPLKTPSKLKLATNNEDVKKYLQASKLFAFETSYHLVINCLQLQICDDLIRGRSSFQSLDEGGALHVVVNKLILDIYPYQKALGSRDNWLKYGDPSPNRDNWMRHHLFEFAENLSTLDGDSSKGSPNQRLSDLLSSVILLRLGDYTVKCVSTSSSRRGGRKFGADVDECKFLCTGNFPRDLPAVYLEFNQYYYYEYGSTRISRTRPVPDPIMFANIAPLRLFFDVPTILWFNALQTNLQKPLAELKKIVPRSETDVTVLTRIEVLMPTITMDLTKSPSFQADAYKIESMQLNCTRVVLTNSIKEGSYLNRLNKSLQTMGDCQLFVNQERFPWIKEFDSKPISSGFLKLMAVENLEYHNQIWVLECDPIWFDFIQRNSQRAQPFMDPFKVTIWSYFSSNATKAKEITSKPSETAMTESDLNIVLCIPTPIKIVLDHDCYLFLLRLLEKFDEFSEFLTNDSRRIEEYYGQEPSGSPRMSLISVIENVVLEVILDREEIMEGKSSSTPSISSSLVSPKRSTVDIGVEDITRLKADPLSVNFETTRSETISLLSSNISEKGESLSGRPSSGYRSLSVRDSELGRSESSFGFTDLLQDMSPNDDDDRSIRSDLSDDHMVTISYENMPLEEEAYFTNSRSSPKLVEEALEATEVTLSSELDDANQMAPQIPKPQIVSLSYVKVELMTVAFVKQARGFHSSLLAQISGVNLNEFQKISYEDYKTAQKNGIKPTEKLTESNDSISNLIVRLDSVLHPSHKSDLLSVKVQNIDTSLNNDTLLQVLDFLNDPDATSVTPALIQLQQVAFKLIDSSLKTPPLVMNLQDTLIERSQDNQIHVLPSAVNGSKHLTRSHVSLLKLNTNEAPNGHDDSNKQALGEANNDLLNNVMLENSRLMKEISALKQENSLLKKKLDQAGD